MSESPADDRLKMPIVGPWSKRKYHFLGRYLDAFTVAMRGKWKELHYIDLFAGAGLARIRNTDEIVRGSPLIAANLKVPFTQVHLCDADPENVAALQSRIKNFAFAKPPRIVCGDANAIVSEVLRAVPRRDALCMTFADPFGLHLDFETVEAVAQLQSDLVILFADNMDALRNWASYYLANPNSTLDRFMGEPGWRQILQGSPADRGAERLRARYHEKLRALDYAHFADLKVQNSQDRDIYTLLYASKAKAGIRIWNNVSQIDEGGQRFLQFPT